ncbi:MAG: MFS transporter [Deltaproteobacteria bacterium]|nr:MFS transporter [Deltaproteobacteria bacterium]
MYNQWIKFVWPLRSDTWLYEVKKSFTGSEKHTETLDGNYHKPDTPDKKSEKKMNHPGLKRFLVNPRKIFFGWWMTIAGGLLCIWGYGYHTYGFSALFKPIADELGFSRTATSVAASITRFEGGLEAPLVGYLSDRYGPRISVFSGIFLVGLGMLLMYWVNSLWSFYLFWSVICATGINISLSMPLDVAITNWFVKKRGTALSVKWVFSGLSGVIGLPIVAWLIIAYGWRMACVRCFIGRRDRDRSGDRKPPYGKRQNII